jgi:5-(carboxyamino)imidazole ribonucleotide synthase
MTTLPPPARLGVVGGGQLGRMFVQAAQRLGYVVGVLSESDDDPAAEVAQWGVRGSSRDRDALRAFAERAQAVTVEFENVHAPGLRWLQRQGVVVRPGWRSVWISQDRIREKTFLGANDVPVTPWRPVRTDSERITAADDLVFPVILKTSASGYDGKGQIRVEAPTGLASAWDRLGRVSCVAESVVPFVAELSVVAVRGADGASAAYPVNWNRHRDHILDTTLAPAPIGPVVSLLARDLALAILNSLAHVGVLTVEYFLTEDGSLLVNELAPRPHNSGHLTMDAAACSQFEQQVRALCGLPLGGTDLSRPAAMANLLGDLWSPAGPRWEATLRADPEVRLHLYGKKTPAIGRKMGHLTVLDPDPNEALARVLAARRMIR